MFERKIGSERCCRQLRLNMEVNSPSSTFRSFLMSHGIFVDESQDNIQVLVQQNYDLLSEENLRSLVQCALLERDKNISKGYSDDKLLGTWGVVIDTVKDETLRRRDRALKNMQLLIKLSDNEVKLNSMLTILKRESQIDNTLKELLRDFLVTSRQNSQLEISRSIELIIRSLASLNEPSTLSGLSTSKKDTPIKYGPLKTNTTTVKSNNNLGSTNTEIELQKINNNDDDESEDEDEDEDEVEEVFENNSHENEEQEQKLLFEAGTYLRNLLNSCAGDAKRFKDTILTDYKAGLIGKHFQTVLNDNILACKQAGYINKLKILEFVRTALQDEITADNINKQSISDSISNVDNNDNQTISNTDHFTTHHAPKFVDRILLPPKLNNEELSNILESFIDGTSTSDFLLKDSIQHINKKKKNIKKKLHNRLISLTEKLSVSLEEQGWAVCDNFLPLDLIRRVRIEASLFIDHYEQSEIWVGKQADIGAQLSVPSVRGDKVLWVCGGRHHTAVENRDLSRNMKTIGEVEPCKLEVKAHAPLRRFTGIKELLVACDGLMDELKTKSPKTMGIFDRSDAMLAIYPGNGTRFANHIDNTTGDGRRLTVVFYLNPGWTKEQGGALRVTGRDGRVVDVYPDAGRVAIFYSSEIAHEVLPTFGDRFAMTIWYYDKEERNEAVTAAAKTGKVKEVEKAGIHAQQLAKQFIAELMGGDEVGEDGGQPTVAELATLTARVDALSDDVLGIVASITGAPSTQSFRDGFPMLTPEDLKSMRALFRRMGLK
eukprot:gene4085-8124_t